MLTQEEELGKLRQENDYLQRQLDTLHRDMEVLKIKNGDFNVLRNRYVTITHGLNTYIIYVKKIYNGDVLHSDLQTKHNEISLEGPAVVIEKHYIGSTIRILTNCSLSDKAWKSPSSSITIITKEEAVKLVNKRIEFVNFFK